MEPGLAVFTAGGYAKRPVVDGILRRMEAQLAMEHEELQCGDKWERGAEVDVGIGRERRDVRKAAV